MEQQMSTQNSQRRIGRVAASIAVLGLVALSTACSGEDLAENLAERQIEQETGGDVDIDLDGDCVSIETEEGSMTCDENGNMIIESPEGSVVINADGDGNIEASSDDGTYTATAGSELPDEFPSDIAVPGGFTVLNSSVMGDATMKLVTVGFGTDASVDDAGAAINASLEAAGYTRQQSVDQNSMLYVTYLNGEETATVTVAEEASGTGQDTVVSMTVQLAP
jgi:hypothetical protein